MTYKAKLKVHFDTEWTYTASGIYDDETLPEEHYTFEIPCEDINSMQLFRFFGTVARAMGHSDLGIMKGACYLAFNDMNSQEDMRKVAEEYDIVMSEDVAEKVNTAVKTELEIQKDLNLINAHRILNTDPSDNDDGTTDYWEKLFWDTRNSAITKIAELEKELATYKMAQTPVD